MPAGQYDVAFSATHYDSEWYSNARSHAGATPVTVSDGQQYSYTAALELRNLTAGRTSSVAFRLNRAGARLLRRAPPKVKATLTLSFTSGGRTTMARSTIVLRRR